MQGVEQFGERAIEKRMKMLLPPAYVRGPPQGR
jgi:hypothetical protein